ncbi:MAG TPA: cupin-like domain-containing protein [Kofleriaceae bacterium]|jgi:hypothetical protein
MLGDWVSKPQLQERIENGRRESWLDLDADEFRRNYNRRPFVVHHRLAEHPAFQLERLRALCHRLPRELVKFRAGKVPHDANFDTSLDDFKTITFEQAVDGLEEHRAYIAIYNAERDEEYGRILGGLLGELAGQTEAVEPGLNWYSTYIFISTQDALTPYHMDREMNFLLQIRGTKTVRLWDPNDPDVMTPAERDRLLSFTGDPRPAYKDALEQKAMIFELEPGLGVHHPFIAPHLVHTRSGVSISLAITFRTPKSDEWTDAHRFNHVLMRRLGMSPRTVGESALVDRGKAGLVRTVRRLRKLTRPRV